MKYFETSFFNLILLVILLLAYWVSQMLLGADLVDDSYIFLRYAENFANGSGLVFNANEYIEGYTSLLWTLCLGSIAWLGFDLVWFSKLLSAAFGIATILLLFYTCQLYLPSSHNWLAFIPGWFLATTPAFVYWTWSAMDTALFTFLFFCTFVIFLKQVETAPFLFWSGFWFVLATLARLDMLSVLPVYLFFLYYFNRQQPSLLFRKYVSFLLPISSLLLHFIWRYYFYGTWLPNTYYAKAAGIPISVLVSHGLNYTFEFLKVYGIYLGVILFSMLLTNAKGFAKEWQFSTSIITIWIGYVTYVGGDHFSMFRFYIPLLPLLAFLLVFLISWLVRQPRLSIKYSLTLSASAILFLSMLNYTIYTYGGGRIFKAEVENAKAWSQVGHWMGENLPGDARIATVVAGAIPYYSGLATYDLVGLTNREVAVDGDVYLEGKVGHQKYNTDYILAQRPDYIISPASGLFQHPVGAGLDKSYSYSLYDLITDERTMQLYEYQVVELGNGRYIEFLQLKATN